MEEKSVEIPKIKGPLREQDSIRALLELLEQQGMEQEKGDVIRMADHIDSMEMQLGTVLKELGEVKKQLGVMQESKVKLFAVNTIQKAEHQVKTVFLVTFKPETFKWENGNESLWNGQNRRCLILKKREKMPLLLR